MARQQATLSVPRRGHRGAEAGLTPRMRLISQRKLPPTVTLCTDVVEGARVKGVLGCPSVPGSTEGVNEHPGLTVLDPLKWSLDDT